MPLCHICLQPQSIHSQLKENRNQATSWLFDAFVSYLSFSRINTNSAIEPHWNIWAALITMQHKNPPWIFIAGPLRSREPLLSHTMCFRSTSKLLAMERLLGIYKIQTNKNIGDILKKKENKNNYSMWTKNSQFNNLTILKESQPLRRLKDLIYRYLKGLTLVEVKGKTSGKRNSFGRMIILFRIACLLQRGILKELQFRARCLLKDQVLLLKQIGLLTSTAPLPVILLMITLQGKCGNV